MKSTKQATYDKNFIEYIKTLRKNLKENLKQGMNHPYAQKVIGIITHYLKTKRIDPEDVPYLLNLTTINEEAEKAAIEAIDACEDEEAKAPLYKMMVERQYIKDHLEELFEVHRNTNWTEFDAVKKEDL